MKRFRYISLFLILATVLAFGFKKPGKVVKLNIPEYWPKPTYDLKNKPLTDAKIELGRQLFYDPILSADNSISCASCHSSYTAFTHVDHPLSHGINDSIGRRNSPVLINLAWQNNMMWDGAVNHIENQALAPIHNAAEMGSDILDVVNKLQVSQKYKALFKKSFNDTVVTGQHILIAIAQFELTLISSNSKYDKVIRGQKGIQFTEQETRGYELFKTNCASCHQEPLFTSNGFENNGLPIDSVLMDLGRYEITNQSKDSLKFKVPTLRNIEFSAPYMHDGRFESLNEVLKHYSKGIFHSSTLSTSLKNGLVLSHENQVDIIAFLLTLTDKDFLFNPKFAYPKK